MPGVDYSRFDRLVAEDEQEDKQVEECRKQTEEDRAKRELEAHRQKELDALRRAEEEWRKQNNVSDVKGSVADAAALMADTSSASETLKAKPPADGARSSEACEEDPAAKSAGSTTRSKASAWDYGSMTPEDFEQVDVDDFFRPLTEEEAEEKRRLKREREERRRQREEAAGRRPLRDTGMSPEQVREQVEKIEADRREMTLLMDRCDRPAVKARLGEFLVEMDNDLARLREDPLELDDDDRRELRLFHLRKMRLPGAARAQREFAEETMGAPKALGPASGDAGTPHHEEEIWQEVPTFMLDLGDSATPTVTIDARIEAAERLPERAVSCAFREDSFDLRVLHGLEGKRYRLFKTCLQRDIDPGLSSFRVKRNHIVIELAKLPEECGGHDSEAAGERRYPLWTDLCAVDKGLRNPAPHSSGASLSSEAPRAGGGREPR